MTMYAYCFLAVLLAGPLPESTIGQTEVLVPPEAGLLISRNEALADIDQLCAVLVTQGARQTESLLDYRRLQARLVARLEAQGVKHVECKTGVTPRLHIRVETIRLKNARLCVYRVQTALSRIVTFTDHRELQVQADVWRLNPVMAAVPEADFAGVIDAAVLTQVEAFAGAYRAARRFNQRAGDVAKSAVASPFVASKSSSVFHRADCRWARNIAVKNRVTYVTRAEAVQAGKRPCKTCKP